MQADCKRRKVKKKKFAGWPAHQSIEESLDVPLMHEKRTGHVSLMTKEDWKMKNEHRIETDSTGKC